ncbi:MAG: divalent metal cation transporter, partial [Bdellovibrionales bacterium]|nr:divalent metal cation transporter [Oligoflexia bacterium]
EAIILGLISTIGICYFVELWWAKPACHLVAQGLIPASDVFSTREPLYLAIAILGATVMPHNLYLHSSIIQTRDVGTDDRHKKTALRFATLDTVISLFFAFLVNAAILILAGTAFHFAGSTGVTQIDDAYHLLEPMVGGKFASVLFGVALLASGQSSTFTGTIAGQVLLEGFLQLKMPCWKRRVITRGLALAPALFGVWYFGDHGVQKLLVLSQVVLSLQLPFAIYPLIKFNRDKQLMGNFRSGSLLTTAGWSLFLLITGANLWLIFQLLGIR